MGDKVKVGPAELKALRALLSAETVYVWDAEGQIWRVAVYLADQEVLSEQTRNKLACKGLLEWYGGWAITDLGRKVVEEANGG